MSCSATLVRLAPYLAFAVQFTCACAAQTPLADLNVLVERQHYGAALEQLREAKLSDDEITRWLRGHAEAGHVPLQYELAARLFPSNRAESFKWYSRGRLARTLDSAECAAKDASFGTRARLDARVEAVRDAAVEDPEAFNDAIQEALDWENRRTRIPSSAWICGEGIQGVVSGIKPEAQRRKARADALDEMRIAARAMVEFQRAVKRGAASNVKIIESGIAVIPNHVGRWAGWVDDRHLLFVGFPPGTTEIPMIKGKPRGYGQVALIWDTVEDRVRVFLDAPIIHELCVDGLHVVIDTYADDGKRTIFEGEFPNLAGRTVDSSTQVLSPLQVDCDPPHGEPGPSNALANIWLRNGDGHIERPITPGLPKQFSVLHRLDGEQIPLPIASNSTWLLAYAEWKHAYLLAGQLRRPGTVELRPSGRRHGDETVFFWLYPDGRTESVVLPYGQWDTRDAPSTLYRPTKFGLVVSGGDPENDNLPGFSGLYVFQNEANVKRIIAGPSRVAAISPNGCAVALAHAPLPVALRETITDAKARQAMRIVDLCTGK